MTRATMSRLGRMFTAEVSLVEVKPENILPISEKAEGATNVVVDTRLSPNVERRAVVTRKPVIDMAVPRSPITFVHGGVEITEMVAPGQIINKRKAYKRYMEKNRAWRNKR